MSRSRLIGVELVENWVWSIPPYPYKRFHTTNPQGWASHLATNAASDGARAQQVNVAHQVGEGWSRGLIGAPLEHPGESLIVL